MNCISYKEAEMYCTAVGKRLPTATEWEYAARSMNSEYYCPWAPPEDVSVDNPICKRGREPTLETHRVCTYSDESTAQGLCDMASNVTELVTDEHIIWKLERDVPTRGGCNQDPGITMFDKPLPFNRRSVYAPETKDQDARVGFRCVRDVSLAGS